MVKSRNLSLVCLRVFASFIGVAGAARTPSVGRRAHADSGCKPEFSQNPSRSDDTRAAHHSGLGVQR